MVNWLATDADVRLLAAVFAAEPGFRPDAKTIAILYGRGATDHAINHQLQRIRKLAKDLTEEARNKGADLPRTTPRTPRIARTPRTPRTRSTGKSGASASAKNKLLDTPSKKGKCGNSVVDPITVESESEDESDAKSTKSEGTAPADDDNVKKEEDVEDDVKPKKFKGFASVTPFKGFGQSFWRGDSAPVRVNSQVNGYIDTTRTEPAQNSGSGYNYDMIADYM